MWGAVPLHGLASSRRGPDTDAPFEEEDRPPRTKAPVRAQQVDSQPDGNKCQRSVLTRPYGLPRWVTMSAYRSDPVCALSLYNYKVEAQIGASRHSLMPVVSVIDTGAGPNLVKAELVPAQVLQSLDSNRQVVNLASASNHRLETLGVVHLIVQVGQQASRHPFVVTRQLSADVILGCTFLDNHVEGIFPRRRYIELASGDIAPILRRESKIPSMQRSKEDPKLPRGPLKDQVTDNLLRVTKMVVIPPGTEQVVRVSTPCRGLRFLETRPDIYDRKRVAMSNGLAGVRPNVPFDVKVANFSHRPQTLRPHEQLGQAWDAPVSTYAIHFEGEEKESPSDEGGAGPASFAEDRVPEVEPEDAKPQSLEDVDLSHLDPPLRSKVRKMLEPFASMWSGHLGTIKVTEHRIPMRRGLTPSSRSPIGPDVKLGRSSSRASRR